MIFFFAQYMLSIISDSSHNIDIHYSLASPII